MPTRGFLTRRYSATHSVFSCHPRLSLHRLFDPRRVQPPVSKNSLHIATFWFYTVLASLGTHEHWNDSLHMQYSRNLGTGNGIELVKGDVTTSLNEDQPTVASQIVLQQNYPNPFNPSTTIKFELPGASHVTMSVYDMVGREVSVLVNETSEAGIHEVKFDGSNLASGVYVYRLQVRPLDSAIGRDSRSGVDDLVQAKKFVVLR
jgi:hypothetical protein